MFLWGIIGLYFFEDYIGNAVQKKEAISHIGRLSIKVVNTSVLSHVISSNEAIARPLHWKKESHTTFLKFHCYLCEI